MSANKVEANFTRDGKHAETATFSVSKDGKVLSILAKGTAGGWQAFTNDTSGKAVRGFAGKRDARLPAVLARPCDQRS